MTSEGKESNTEQGFEWGVRWPSGVVELFGSEESARYFAAKIAPVSPCTAMKRPVGEWEEA